MFSLSRGPSACRKRRKETTKNALVAWTNAFPHSSGVLLGCQQSTCLWRKRVVGFFINGGTSNRLVRRNTFLAALLRTDITPFIGSRPGPFPSQQDYPRRGRLEFRNTFPVPNSHHRSSVIAPQLFCNHHSSLETSAPVSADAAHAKVFVHPLFRCGRMYRRPGHPKGHVRSHTMERQEVLSTT